MQFEISENNMDLTHFSLPVAERPMIMHLTTGHLLTCKQKTKADHD